MPIVKLVRRVRSFFALEWIGEDDLYLQAATEITPTLHLGRRPSPEHIDDLQRRGITHIVSCLEEKRRPHVEFLTDRFEHLFIPANDEMDHNLDGAVQQFLAFVDDARATDPSAVVMVHCEVGVSRSASLTIALLMRDQELSFLDAYEFTRSKRIQVLPNLAFASQLQQREHRLQPARATANPSSLAVYLRKYCAAPSDVDELEAALERNAYDAPTALRDLYGGEIPRVVQGTRSGR